MIIRDPIYNYIYLTKVEQKIVDSPMFQRLRHISQNGAACYTYPSNHGCRFLHSLGTMEIAGRMVVSILLNSEKDTLEYLKIECDELIDACRKTAAIAGNLTGDAERAAVESSSTIVYSHYGLEHTVLRSEVEAGAVLSEAAHCQFVWLVMFEAVRIAALLHDLGHFPYSHSLEGAFASGNDEKLSEIEGIFNKKHKDFSHVSALHERIGIGLLDVVLPEKELNPFERICRIAARMILCSTESDDGASCLLHSIIAGDLDADRLDYSMRDPRFSGMELGAFDLDRITSNILVVGDGGRLRVVPSIRALPAIESFYHQRYLVYKYLVYHHGTMRMNELIKRIVHQLAAFYAKGSPANLIELLRSRRFDYLWVHCNDERFFTCTEDWLFSLMCELRESRDNLMKECAKEDLAALGDLLTMVDTFVCRKSLNFITLTKRTNLYEELVSRIDVALNSRTYLERRELVERVLGACEVQGSRIFLEIKSKYKVDVFVLETKPKTVFNGDGKAGALLACKDGKLARLTDCSPYLASLLKCVDGDQQFHVVLFGDGIKDRARRDSNLVEAIKGDLINAIAAAVAIQFDD